jgi:hypothetical protein
LTGGHVPGGGGGLSVGGPNGGGGPSVSGPSGGSSSGCNADKCEAASPGIPRGHAFGPPDFDVLDTLTRLLPPGASRRDTETQPGYAGITVVDSLGTTRIDVNVQLEAVGVASSLDCGVRHLPAATECNVVTQADGTVMLTSEGPNIEGPTSIRELDVDVLYPDGRRVVFGEWNAADEKRGSVTRRVPLLTLDQLVTLATAPDWRR